MIDIALIQACAPSVAPQTMQRVIQVESGGDPFVLNIEGVGAVRSESLEAAAVKATTAINNGTRVAIGLMQVESTHLHEFNVDVRQALDQCTNLRLGSQILSAAYTAAAKQWGEGQRALQAALSAYNTGDFVSGFRNCYVALYYQMSCTTLHAVTINPYTAPTLVRFNFMEASDEKPNAPGSESAVVPAAQ